MKNLSKVLSLISINLLFSNSIIVSDLGKFNSSPSLLLNQIEMDHSFSFSSHSMNGLSQSYSIYTNSSSFAISNKTKFYGNLNLMYSLLNTDYNNQMGYSIGMGIKYNLNENTEFIFQISANKYPTFHNNYLGDY